MFREVRNDNQQSLKSVGVVVTFYDSSGGIKYADSGSLSGNTDLAPGQTVVYSISTFKEDLMPWPYVVQRLRVYSQAAAELTNAATLESAERAVTKHLAACLIRASHKTDFKSRGVGVWKTHTGVPDVWHELGLKGNSELKRSGAFVAD